MVRRKFTVDGPPQVASRVLNEAMVNAIQHGNLELSSDLRQEDEAVFAPPYSRGLLRVLTHNIMLACEQEIDERDRTFDVPLLAK